MKKYSIKIKGKTPYMQHRMDDQSLEDWEKRRGRIIERPDVALEDYKRALFHSYNNGNGEFFMPSDHLMGAFINAGGMGDTGECSIDLMSPALIASVFFGS